MKIIYLTCSRIPTEKAHGIQIMQMLEAFSNFTEVELVIPKRRNLIKQDAFDYYGVKRNFQITWLPVLDLVPLDKYIGHLGFWLTSFSFLVSASFYLLFRKFDVLYTRDKMMLSLALGRKNIIFEAHTFPKKYFFYKWLLKKVKAIIVITEKLRRLYLEKGISAKKVLTAPDGVDMDRFSIKKTKEECRLQLNLPLDKQIVLYTGHLYQWKGVDALLEAARQFPMVRPCSPPSVFNQFLKTLFVFVGGTEKDIAEFKEKAKGISNVMIVGHRPYSEIPYFLKAADVLVLPNSASEEISKSWTSPLKMFEYMAAEKPIVASDLASIREILNENNAFLCKPDDSKSLRGAIENALQNPVLSAKIAQRAFNDVQNFTWTKRAKAILNFIDYD